MRSHGARNVCAALAKREVVGRPTCKLNLPRQTLSLRQVFRQEQGGVLLGFSSDGNFLVYCVTLGAHYVVQWRRFKFRDFYGWREDGEVPHIAFKLSVDGGATAYGVSTLLEVWQTVDDNLVLTVTAEGLTEDREISRLCRVVVAPSPMFDDGGLAVSVTSLRFEFGQHVNSQKMESWQLMQLVKGRTNVYHLLVNTGTAVHVLVFHTWRKRYRRSETESQFEELIGVTPRGLGISYFIQNAWYYPSVSPIKFQKVTECRPYKADAVFKAGVTCICQHLFDVERFLGEFLETFKPLQHYNLIDYDLRLVRASTMEKTVFMTCVMALTPSNTNPPRPSTQHLRAALFLSLELFTGIYHVVRVLKVPGNGDLRQLAQVVARRFLADLNTRVPPDPVATTWDNEAFIREESLQELNNPVYPLSISRA
ncbi:hypothetical protein PPTG_11047 [Phytophthora nicotianae INRA-310]|uniref:Uncharacterized protein n=2 Tax=Phytophthora nicotianae TaxID=4792 RepID=W2Q8V1_PHYN3|nr:hypothetical protein PPTG_11047 [Phytophthora nicotianae INRA-310]ETN08979.1 hypothetical protein PPTG_11047 [Phytophthora nicotianae INRA-310]